MAFLAKVVANVTGFRRSVDPPALRRVFRMPWRVPHGAAATSSPSSPSPYAAASCREACDVNSQTIAPFELLSQVEQSSCCATIARQKSSRKVST